MNSHVHEVCISTQRGVISGDCKKYSDLAVQPFEMYFKNKGSCKDVSAAFNYHPVSVPTMAM